VNPVVTAGGLIFTGTRDRKVRALDSATGTVLWEATVDAALEGCQQFTRRQAGNMWSSAQPRGPHARTSNTGHPRLQTGSQAHTSHSLSVRLFSRFARNIYPNWIGAALTAQHGRKRGDVVGALYPRPEVRALRPTGYWEISLFTRNQPGSGPA